MRLTVAHLRVAGTIAGTGLFAFAAILMANYLIGHASPFMPGVISAIVMAAGIFLLRRYGTRGPVDPHRRKGWLFSGLAAAGALAAVAFAAALWVARIHPGPSAACAAPEAIVEVASAGEAKRPARNCGE
jgi:hypothetical protein